jgi:outer membrane lipoprotein-sorting protein
MKGDMMKTFALCFCLIFPVAICLAETETPMIKTQEPQLYDHMLGMKQTQEQLLRRSPEEQEQLQPQVRRAELQACQRLRQDRQEGVREDEYRRQGGDEFIAYVLQFEQYCKTLR